MRLVYLFGLLLACGQPEHVVRPTTSTVPRLLPPPPLVELDAPDAVYRTAVALQLQPGWAQFLDDCRLRLPASHPLNSFSLSTTAELAVDASGRIASIHFASSGNADFDRAVRQVIGDAEPLPRPPRALWGDDDLVHVEWLFARDRRQAGPATSRISMVDLPVREVVHRLVAAGELARAATRLRRAPGGTERDAAIYELMTAGIREAALGSMDGTTRRGVIDAIGAARVIELSGVVRDLLSTTTDFDVRLHALDAGVRLSDRAMIAIAEDRLRVDLHDDRMLAAADARTLVALGASDAVASVIRDALGGAVTPELGALAAAAYVRIPELGPRVVEWLRTGDTRVRAAACGALVQDPSVAATSALVRALGDRDATVRAGCLDAVLARAAVGDMRALTAQVAKLAADRDIGVRARAIAVLANLLPARLPDASSDRAAEVRASYAHALGVVDQRGGGKLDVDAALRAMLDDRDADVRAAAWHAWLSMSPGPQTHALRASLAARAATDPAPQVRAASLAGLDDDVALLALATSDDQPDVRTAAFVALGGRRGRTGIADLALERFAQAGPASAERVRTALAWLLAR